MPRSKRLLLASRAAVLVLAIVSSYFALRQIVIMWAPCGNFGIQIDPTSAIVSYVDPRYASKEIAPGDRVDLAAISFRERSYLYEAYEWPVGTRLPLKITRSGSTRTANLVVVREIFPNVEAIAVFVMKIVALIYILIAVVLVWNRPNPMLWGLALFLLETHTRWITDLSSPVLAAFVLSCHTVTSALEWSGLIVFAARFPDNRTTASTKYWDIGAAAAFLYSCFLAPYQFVPLFTARPIPDHPYWMADALNFLVTYAVFAALCWKVLRTKARSQWRGFNYVVVGYGVGIVLGWLMVPYLFGYLPGDLPNGYWWMRIVERVLMLALPASVGYAVIRYRAFGLSYLANRALVYGGFALGAGSTIIVSVWFVSALTSSALGVVIAMFVALLAGMALRSCHSAVVRFVDRIFLRRRYEALTSLDTIRHTLRTFDDPKRLTEEVASTLGLASLAVFSRAADGGFVRKAAFGWPAGSAWHLLPQEMLTRTLDGSGAAIVRISDDRDDELALPADDARPQFALAVRRGDRVERAILVGPQRNGASLDRDAMRSLHGVFDETILA